MIAMAMMLPFLFVLFLSTSNVGVDGYLVDPWARTPVSAPTVTMATASSESIEAGKTQQRPPQHVVIVGGGIGGLSTAFDARHTLRKDDTITVVSDRSHFEFTPSNPWVAVHKRTPKEIRLDLETILPKHHINFVHAKATKLDAKGNVLTLQSKSDDGEKESILNYDYLVIATGPRLGFEDVPGLKELHFNSISSPPNDENTVVSICTTDHATHASQAVDRLLQNPGPVVVGATQGASCFGPLYEFALLLHHYVEKKGGRKLLDQCPISLITPEPYIGHLGLRGAGQSEKILTQLLKQKEIEWYTNCKVNKVTKDGVLIEYCMEEGESKSTPETKRKFLPSRLTMLIPPFKGMKLWQKVPGLTDQNGMILVDRHQQSLKYPNIFGVGVCVHLDPLEHTPVHTGPPKTGYMIESMGTACVKNIRELADHQQNKNHNDSNSDDASNLSLHTPKLNGLCITDFGDEGAIFLTLPQMPPRRTDITIEGKIGTMAKMAFEKYFLFKIQTGDTDPYYEKYLLHLIGVDREEKDKVEDQ
jgi:NADH dehydrogenase FAD-containing subunit